MRFAPTAAALLTLFTAAAMAQAPLPAPAPAPEPSLPYTVKPSDKLIRLSRDLLVTPGAWGEVARFNQMKDPNFIKPGQRLNIPLRLLKFQPAQARVVSVAGDARLAGAAATVGMAVPEGARLQTGANSSAVVQLGDGTQVKLAAADPGRRGHQPRLRHARRIGQRFHQLVFGPDPPDAGRAGHTGCAHRPARHAAAD